MDKEWGKKIICRERIKQERKIKRASEAYETYFGQGKSEDPRNSQKLLQHIALLPQHYPQPTEQKRSLGRWFWMLSEKTIN